jgi:outer membrane biosynthesis protein TonB
LVFLRVLGGLKLFAVNVIPKTTIQMGIMVTSMSVRCPQCFYENEERYRFCGMCGIALPRIGSASEPEVKPVRPVTAAINSHPPPAMAPVKEPVREPAPVRENERAPLPVTGMSFLGLSQDQNPYPDRSLDYLLEEEEKPGRGRTYIALILLLAAVGMLGWRWRHSGFFSQTHPVVATAPSPQDSTAQDSSATPAATTPPASTSPSANPPAQAAKGPQESDLPAKGDTPKAAESIQNDDQVNNATPAPSENSTEQAAAPPAAVKPIPVKKATPQAATNVASRAPKAAAVPTEAPTLEQDPVEAQGEKYLYGSGGVPQNCGLAQRSLLESAQRANPKAQSVLGTMYATGHCVGRDLPTAYRWFAKASHQDPNNARITRDLEVLWKQMTAGERQLAVNSRE